jgi:colanic acid/amylovoran biosynthesis glycosyltransferase
VSSRNLAVFRMDLFKRSETFITSQAKLLTRYQPHYVGNRLSGAAPEGATVSVATGGRLGKAAIAMGSAWPYLRPLRGRHIDILHAHFSIDGVFAAPLARRLSVPLIVTLHGFDVTTRKAEFLRSGKPALTIAALRESSLQAVGDRFLCVSDFIRSAAIQRGYPEERTFTVPLGIDTDRDHEVLSRDENLVVHVARLVEKKGTSDLLKAMRVIVAARPFTKLVVVGEGPLRHSLEKLAKSLGIGASVSFVGGVTHEAALQWIGTCSVVAVPSVTASDGDCEGLPTVVFEAGALAKPVVATRHSGIPEAIKHDQNGLLVDEGDHSALARAILEVLNNSQLADRFSKNAKTMIAARYSARDNVARVEEIYDQAIEEFSLCSNRPGK